MEKTIATSFTIGNGTKENPYQISKGSELLYFKQLIEGEQSDIYCDKHFVLTKNLNFNNFSITPIKNYQLKKFLIFYIVKMFSSLIMVY